MTDEPAANDPQAHLEALRQDHRELDRQIAELSREAGGDQLEIARLKKRKLRLKDQIELFVDSQIPDIIA